MASSFLKWSRRDFIEKTILGAAAVGAGALSLACSNKRDFGDKKALAKTEKNGSLPPLAPSDRVRVAMVGMRGFGMKLSASFAAVRGCEITHVCDVDTAVGADGVAHVEKLTGKKPRFEQDLRKLFEIKDIDAVVLAIPHHWHALAAVWAMRAGKHVYLEKPVTHEIAEGRSLLAAARKYGRVAQSGTQLRSSTSMAKAVSFIRGGGLGEVKLAKCLAYKRRAPIGPPGAYEPPSTVDYDLWCGPARMLPVTRKRFHYDWHWFWEYGNGGLGNNGVHRVDLARWAMDLKGYGDRVLGFGGRFGDADAGVTPNTQMVFHVFGDKMVIQELRGLATNPYLGCKNGVLFFGSEGYLHYEGGEARIFDRDGKHVRSLADDEDAESHQANFVCAVRAGDPGLLNGGLAEGIASAAMCHVGSICHRTGREARESEVAAALERLPSPEEPIHTLARTRAHLAYKGIHDHFTLGPDLVIDQANDDIPDNEMARSMLSRQYREGFALPGPKDV